MGSNEGLCWRCGEIEPHGMDCGCLIEPCFGLHPDHIADATEKGQPATAPLLEEVENLIWTFRCDLRRATPGDVSEMLLTLVNADDLHKAINLISDLTRRLAGAEADLADTREDSTVLAAVTKEWMDANAILGNPADGPLCEMERQRDTERRRAEAAEARVREMEATIDAMAEAHAHDDMALTAAYMNGVHEGKKQAEAFKARVMAWALGRCGACEHEGSEDDTCYNCQSDYEQSNWTLPQALEVGE